MHNGAAESLAAVVADVKHRTDDGRLPDQLSDPADQALVVKFLESIDDNTVPFVPLAIRRQGGNVFVGFDSIAGVYYKLETRTTLTGAPSTAGGFVVGSGQRMELSAPIDTTTKFIRLVAGP